jgi:hypothetical protein
MQNFAIAVYFPCEQHISVSSIVIYYNSLTSGPVLVSTNTSAGICLCCLNRKQPDPDFSSLKPQVTCVCTNLQTVTLVHIQIVVYWWHCTDFGDMYRPYLHVLEYQPCGIPWWLQNVRQFLWVKNNSEWKSKYIIIHSIKYNRRYLEYWSLLYVCNLQQLHTDTVTDNIHILAWQFHVFWCPLLGPKGEEGKCHLYICYD